MNSLRCSFRDDGTSSMMRMGEPSRDQSKTMSVGILGQMRKNTDATKRRTDLNRTPTYSSRKKQNSFKSFRPNSNNKSWLICVLASFFIIGMLTAGAIVGLKYSAIGGWSVFACGIVLLFSVVVFLYVSKKKRIERSAAEQALKPQKFYHTDINDFPFDPLLQRGITSLIYHGQHDCHTCRLMRENENVRRFCPSEQDEDEGTFVNIDKMRASLSSLATASDKPADKGRSPNHHVVVHDVQENVRRYSKTQDTNVKSPEQQETSFIAPHNDRNDINQPENDVTRGDTYTNRSVNTNEETHYTYINDNEAFTDPNDSAADNDISRHVSAAILSRDSILTTKKRKKSRNKSWKTKDQCREEVVSTEEASLSSESEEELSVTSGKLPKGTENAAVNEARRTLSHDSFLTTKKRKLQRIEEWTKRKSRQGEARHPAVKEET